MSDLSVQSKNNIYVDSAKNTTGRANAGSVSNCFPTSDTSDNSVQAQPQNQTKTNDLDSKLKKLVEKTNLTVSQLKEILFKCGFKEEHLNSLQGSKIDELCRMITIAMNCVKDKNGNVDTKKLSMTLILCKIAVVNKGLKSEKEITAFIQDCEKKDLIDIIREKVPSLKNKSIKEISAQELKEALKAAILKAVSPECRKKRDPQMVMDFFMAALSKCDPEEKAKIFHAFALLFRDKDMKAQVNDPKNKDAFMEIQEAYKHLLASFENDVEKINEMIRKVGPEILKELGFDEETIKIINLEAMSDLSLEQIQAIVKSLHETFSQIKEDDIPVLKKALAALNSGNLDSLSDKEKDILKQYKPLFEQTISLVALTAIRPELKEKLEEHFRPLLDLLKKMELSDEVYRGVYVLYSNHKEAFSDMSENDFIKKINEISHNEFSSAIGDKNPENLAKTEDNKENFNFGFGQRNNFEEHQVLLASKKDSVHKNNEQDITNQSFVLINDGSKKDEQAAPANKYQTIMALTKKALFEGLTKKSIKYNVLSYSDKLYVNNSIESESKAKQSVILNNMQNSAAVEVIKHTNINPEDVNVVLDFDSNKALERDRKAKAKS